MARRRCFLLFLLEEGEERDETNFFFPPLSKKKGEGELFFLPKEAWGEREEELGFALPGGEVERISLPLFPFLPFDQKHNVAQQTPTIPLP